jgi:hypothetical protein
MVEICVDVADPNSVQGLMRGLAELFGASSLSYDRSRSEVRVRSGWESRAVSEVIDVVDRWLAADGIASAKLSIGDRSTPWSAHTRPRRHIRERHDRLLICQLGQRR